MVGRTNSIFTLIVFFEGGSRDFVRGPVQCFRSMDIIIDGLFELGLTGIMKSLRF